MRNLSISQKLVLALIFISILPYAAISYFNYSIEKNSLEKNVFDELNALSESKSTHIATIVNLRMEQ
ncbi:MAG TPA: hypothetical protein VIO11_06100, partial [Candidatus Methanoperedens sp.]